MINMALGLWDESIVFASALFIGYALHPIINSIIVYSTGTILRGIDEMNNRIQKYRKKSNINNEK